MFAAGVSFDQDTITSRLRELAFLNAGAVLQVRFLKKGKAILPPAAAAADGGNNKTTAAAADSSKQRRARQSSSADAAATVGPSSNSNGSSSSSDGAAEGWQVFRAESGLKEYVLW